MSSAPLSATRNPRPSYPSPSFFYLEPLQVFTITNYTGTSRDYLKQLLDLLGARFSAELDKKKATHVIAAA